MDVQLGDSGIGRSITIKIEQGILSVGRGSSYDSELCPFRSSSPPHLQTGRGLYDLRKNDMGVRIDPKQDMEKFRDLEAPLSGFVLGYKGLGLRDANRKLLLRQTRTHSSLN